MTITRKQRISRQLESEWAYTKAWLDWRAKTMTPPGEYPAISLFISLEWLGEPRLFLRCDFGGGSGAQDIILINSFENMPEMINRTIDYLHNLQYG